MEILHEELLDRQKPRGYVIGDDPELELPLENATEVELKAWKTWYKKDKKVMFLISQNVSNSMIGHIQELNSSKEAWNALDKLYTTNTRARKIQLKNKLNNMKKGQGMSINDYALKISCRCSWVNKSLCR